MALAVAIAGCGCGGAAGVDRVTNVYVAVAPLRTRYDGAFAHLVTRSSDRQPLGRLAPVFPR